MRVLAGVQLCLSVLAGFVWVSCRLVCNAVLRELLNAGIVHMAHCAKSVFPLTSPSGVHRRINTNPEVRHTPHSTAPCVMH